MEANDFGQKAHFYEQEATKDSAIITQAKKDEMAAEQLAAEDKKELKSVRALSSAQSLRFDTDADLGPSAPDVSDGTDASESADDLDKQLSAVDSKLQSLNVAPLYQSRSMASFGASRHTDDVRFHTAVNSVDGWSIRRALNAARVAAKRAADAKVIANNEMAIADAESRRVARLRAQQAAARDGAAHVEATMRRASDARRAAKAGAFGSAMRSYTGQLQGFVAKDMDTLGRLKHAEDSAAFGPHVASGLWRQAPTPSALPDVDPATFMGDAPFRDADSLADYKAVRPGATTQLAERAPGAGAGGAQAALDGDSIARAMVQERRQLARLTRMASGARGGSALSAAAAGGAAPWGTDAAGLAPTQALEQAAGAGGSGAAPPAGEAFTSFATGAARGAAGGDVSVSDLDDGALITDARPAVGLVRVPLGAHEVRRLAGCEGSWRRPAA
jgi:hypothetical protein